MVVRFFHVAERGKVMLRQVVSALVFVVIVNSPISAQSYGCNNDSEHATTLKEYIISLVTAQPSDSMLYNTRIRLQLPGGSSEIVELVSDPSICAAAGAAFHAVVSPANPPAQRLQLVVVKVGADRFVVFDPEERSPKSEFQMYTIFDLQWNKLAGFAS